MRVRQLAGIVLVVDTSRPADPAPLNVKAPTSATAAPRGVPENMSWIILSAVVLASRIDDFLDLDDSNLYSFPAFQMQRTLFRKTMHPALCVNLLGVNFGTEHKTWRVIPFFDRWRLETTRWQRGKKPRVLSLAR